MQNEKIEDWGLFGEESSGILDIPRIGFRANPIFLYPEAGIDIEQRTLLEI